MYRTGPIADRLECRNNHWIIPVIAGARTGLEHGIWLRQKSGPGFRSYPMPHINEYSIGFLLFLQHQEDDFIYDHEKEHFSFLLPNPVRIIKIHYRNINPEQFKQQIAVFIIS